LQERGEKLQDLGDKSAAMASSAQDFLKNVQELNRRMEAKKWYEL